jgi:hypothetical protein
MYHSYAPSVNTVFSLSKAVRCEHDILPDAMPAQSLKRNSKALVVGPPRRVIATVLSTNVPPPHLENPKKSTELTVCIPIHKEVKLHVKSTKDSPKEAEEKMSDRDVANKEAEEKTSDRDVANKEAGEKISDRDVANKEAEERMNDRDVAKTKDADKPSEEETNEAEIIPEENQPTDIKSPTLSLLKAQDLMFDPKFMYKEYNLRRVRKQEVSPEQSKPQKKKKLDKTSPASKQKGTEKGDELDSKEKDAEPDMSPRLDRVKRGRVEGDKDLSCEPPESKKPREDAEEVEAEATRGESEKQTNPKDDELKGLLDFQVSIPCHGSPPLPLTLTQLLSIPKNDEQNQNSKFAECSPTKEVEKHSKRKNVVKTGSSVAKAAPSVGGGVPEHRLSERSQLICSLCKLKGGISNLGFLFGPYFYHPDTESSADSSTTSSNVEVWLHEDCAVWAAGICLVGRELKGLTEALADASKMVGEKISDRDVANTVQLAKDLVLLFFVLQEDARTFITFPVQLRKVVLLWKTISRHIAQSTKMSVSRLTVDDPWQFSLLLFLHCTPISVVLKISFFPHIFCGYLNATPCSCSLIILLSYCVFVAA